jgi:polynucleotide 5'-hydroxyl-kinase GRC3/NOL9
LSVPEPAAEWLETLDGLVAGGGLVLVIGPVDSGKTTFVRDLANCALGQGRAVGVVDADTGQSEVGPPTCITFGTVREPIARLSDVRPEASGFVGSISPQWTLPEHLAQTCSIVRAARRSGTELVVCDTTGLADAPWSDRLKRMKIEALAPDHIVVLSRSSLPLQLDRLLGCLSHPVVHRLRVPGAIVVKPPAMRAQRRAWRLARAFENATERSWAMEEVIVENSWLGSGTALMPAALKQLSTELRTEVLYAETCGRRLGMVVSSAPSYDAAVEVAMRLYGVQSVFIIQESSLDGLVVGMHDSERTLLGIGLISGVDYEARTMRVLTQVQATSAVRIIRLGTVRLRPTGQVLAVLRTGDV